MLLERLRTQAGDSERPRRQGGGSLPRVRLPREGREGLAPPSTGECVAGHR